MPLVAAPNRGYSDWQRIQNYDTGELYTVTNTTTPTQTSTIQDVSRFSTLGQYITGSGGVLRINTVYYLDAAGTIPVGGKESFFPSGGAGGGVALRETIQGPFVKVQWATIGGGNLNNTFLIFANNRGIPPDVLTGIQMICSQQAVSAPVGLTAPVTLGAGAGPAQVWFQDDNTGRLVFEIRATNPSTGNNDFIDEMVSAPAPGARYLVNLPLLGYSFAVSNSNAAAVTYYLAVSLYPTGSS